jgi:hypothetical protein
VILRSGFTGVVNDIITAASNKNEESDKIIFFIIF